MPDTTARPKSGCPMFHVEHGCRCGRRKVAAGANPASAGNPPKGPLGGDAHPAGESRIQRSVPPEHRHGCRVLDPAGGQEPGPPQALSGPPAGVGGRWLGHGEDPLGRQETRSTLGGNRGRTESPGGHVVTALPELAAGQLFGPADQHISPTRPVEACDGLLEELDATVLGIHEEEVHLGPHLPEDQPGHTPAAAEIQEAVGGMVPCE